MAIETKIEWADHTWSPWRGCAHAMYPEGGIHHGCTHCYAEALARRNPAVMGEWGDGGVRVVAAPESWEQVQRWNNAATGAAERPRIFPSLCDPFEYRMSLMTPRSQFFELIDNTPRLDWLLLTKRPQWIDRFTPPRADCFDASEPDIELGRNRHNVWLIYSASDQPSLDAGVPHLLKCRSSHLARVLGVCLGPLLGPVNLSAYLPDLDWVIVEGESGPQARPCRPEWMHKILRQCRDHSVPCYVKQMGANVITPNDTLSGGGDPDRSWPSPIVRHHINEDFQGGDCRIRLKHPKGGDMAEWPVYLRVREFPHAVS